jgi:hypothetical protein
MYARMERDDAALQRVNTFIEFLKKKTGK